MNRTLLEYYEQELDRYGKDGTALSRSGDRAKGLARLYDSGDPFVDQLMQAFAYTQARFALKLDSERDRLPAAMLQMLHPAMCRPVPARTIVQFKWDATGDVERNGRFIKSGTALKMDGPHAIAFRTAGPCVLPAVQLSTRLVPMEDGNGVRLRLSLEPARANLVKLSQVSLSLPEPLDGIPRQGAERFGLRLFLGGTESEASLALYHALTQSSMNGELLVDGQIQGYLPNCVRAVGFDSDESLMPIDPRQLEPLRLLAEYAVMREKFLFIDIVGLHPDLFTDVKNNADVDVILPPAAASLISKVLKPKLSLGCVPAVNLQQERLKSIPLNRRSTEILLAINSRDPSDEKEIFTIDQVRATQAARTQLEYLEMFKPLPMNMQNGLGATLRDRGGYWHARRVPHASDSDQSPSGSADHFQPSDFLLSLIEFNAEATLRTGRSLEVDATCFAREVGHLSGKPLRFKSDRGECESIIKLYPPVSPLLGGDNVLQLLDQLTCGVGLLQTWGDPRAAVSQLLCLFQKIYPSIVGKQQRLSDSFVTSLNVTPAAAYLSGSIARGIKLDMKIDPGGSPHEAYLLVRVLDVVFSAFCSASGFTQLTASYRNGSDKEEVVCPARLGKIALL